MSDSHRPRNTILKHYCTSQWNIECTAPSRTATVSAMCHVTITTSLTKNRKQRSGSSDFNSGEYQRSYNLNSRHALFEPFKATNNLCLTQLIFPQFSMHRNGGVKQWQSSQPSNHWRWGVRQQLLLCHKFGSCIESLNYPVNPHIFCRAKLALSGGFCIMKRYPCASVVQNLPSFVRIHSWL